MRRHRFENKVCFICGSTKCIEKHHLFGGANRSKADKDGLTVFLCRGCHRDNKWAVHQNKMTAQMLKAYGQMQWLWEHQGKSINDFRLRYGANYLRDFQEKER